jgi:hypothetical protein
MHAYISPEIRDPIAFLLLQSRELHPVEYRAVGQGPLDRLILNGLVPSLDPVMAMRAARDEFVVEVRS